MIFLNSASSAAALGFDLPLCTHTDTEGKPREAAESGIYFEIFKKTQYLMNTLYNHRYNAYTYKAQTGQFKIICRRRQFKLQIMFKHPCYSTTTQQMELHFGIVPKFHNSRGMFPRDEIKKTVHSQGLFSGNVPAPGMKSKYRSFKGELSRGMFPRRE